MNVAVVATAVRPVSAAPWRRMVWVIWRQHRATLVGMLVGVGACAAALIATGLPIWSSYDAVVANPGNLNLHDAFALRTNSLTVMTVGLHLVPVLIGAFVGAPLIARELESETYRFAWTQGTSRVRSVTAKLALLGAATAVAGCLIGLLATWWTRPFEALGLASRWQTGQFDVTPLALAGWSLFAFVLGVLAGVVLRRTVPAMATVIAAAAALLALAYWKVDTIVLNVFPLVHRSLPGLGNLQGAINAVATSRLAGPIGSWLLRGWYTDSSGHELSSVAATRIADALEATKGNGAAVSAFLRQHHLDYWISYQPADRYWIFQGSEFLVLALLTGVAGVMAVRLVRQSF